MSDSERLWREFPKTLPEFEAAFPDDEACRRFLIEVRWGGQPRCVRCGCSDVWGLSNGRFECPACGYQTSVTAGTPLHGTRKPLRLWFRAIWEMVARKNGISAKDLQRLMGFGSYRTAWVWLHKLRRCMVRPARERLDGTIQIDDAYVGGLDRRPGRPNGNKAVLLVATEPGGRVRLEHAPNLTGLTINQFARRNLSEAARVTSDGYRSYSAKSLGGRAHAPHLQKRKRHLPADPLQQAHFAVSLVKRWLIGTHHGAVREKHLQAYLDEFEFRYNRRKTNGTGRLVARLLHILVNSPHTAEAALYQSVPSRRFQTP